VANKFDIREGDRWFTNTKYTIKHKVYEADGVTPRNVAGNGFSWMLKRRLTDADADAVLTKTSTIVVTGTFNINPAINTQLVEVPIQDDDTDGTFKAGVYAIELKRTDPGLETVFTQGTAIIRQSAHKGV
jgi:hypothetical protein